MRKFILFLVFLFYPLLIFAQPSSTFVLAVSDDTSTVYTNSVGFVGANVNKSGYKAIVTVTESDPLSATKALNNLASVAINTSLISDLAATDDLGTEALYWKKLYLGSDISFEGATDDAYQTTITITDPTLSDKTITFPNATGEVSLLGQSIDISSETNLSGDTENVLTGDVLSIGSAITRDAEWNTIDFLVGTATASLSGEIVAGAAPGGELGGTWASPTINDSLAVTSFNLTTPTLTTSATVTDAFTFGLGSGKGLIQFDDETTDFVSFSNCNIGIGTTVPSKKLDVAGDVKFGNTSDGYSRFFITQKTARALPTVMMVGADDGTTNELNFGGGTTSGYAIKNIYFRTAADDTTVTGSIRMSVNSTGNVGIGTTSPEGLLEIQGAEATDAPLYLDCDDGDDAADTWIIASEAATNNLTFDNGTTEVATLSSAGVLQIDSDLTVIGGDITLGTSAIFSGGDTTSLNLIDAIDGTTETTLEGALDIAGDVSSTGMASTDINESILGVGGTDTIFPADPNADRYLMWDDDPGALVWATGGGESTTVSDTATLNLTLTGADITGDVILAKDIVAGVGLSGGEDNVLPGAEADTTLTLDLTEVNSATFGSGTFTTLTFDAGVSDPVWTYSSGVANLSTGALQVGGTAVLTSEVDPNVNTEAEIEAITGAYFGASKAVTSGYVWVADGTDFESVAMSGDVSIASGGATTIADSVAVTSWNLTTPTFTTTALLAGILQDNDDMVFECDANSDGTNKYSFTDGASTEIASITEAGLLTTSIINLTGGQIAFPAIAAPSADVNTLDDYEEGTWTATFTCGTSGTITLNAGYKTGSYVKIGKQVTVTIFVLVDSVSSPVGALTLGGLPFTSNSDASKIPGVAIRCHNLNATATTAMQGNVDYNATTMPIEHFAAGATGAAAADIQATSQIMLMATYFTN